MYIFRTARSGCQFFLQFVLKQGEYLELSQANVEHNHTISKEAYRMNYRQRQMNEETKKKAAHLMKLQVNKKLLQDALQKETGKVILLKDLSNIAAKYKEKPQSFQQVIQNLQEQHGCEVDILQKKNILQGIFFQDDKMKQAYKHFPEIMFLDGTYKLINIRFVCYIFVIEDGNGKNNFSIAL